MPLPASDVERELLHTRTFRVDAFARQDGLTDLEAELIDVKGYDFPRSSGEIHKVGRPVHHMHLRITIDDTFTITQAQAAYDAAPYGKDCACIAPDYAGLVGMNLLRGFRHAVKERFGRTQGCTHLSELSYVLPTVAVQSTAGKRRKSRRDPQAPAKRPFELEGCHALSLDAPAVREFYPMWYRPPHEPDVPAVTSPAQS